MDGDGFRDIRRLVEEGIGKAHVEVTDLTGTGDHLGLLVVSDCFEGMALLEAHKMVMDALKEKLKGELHAVKIKTLTYQKAREKSIVVSGEVT